ncbi:hypothetical protein E4U30_002187 [Claviceps sp. LM220 group G6]|nr:hypothetical protein E4U15_007581 [Claviceps sp. LM218 group G6]KAG6095632.1 hypothetical protein E4U30_002187 [Claviceps sp. LM220 group G6]
MFKQILVLAGAAAASSLQLRYPNPALSSRTTEPATILVSSAEEILVVSFDGANFTEKSRTNINATTSWLTYAGPDHFYAVNEDGKNTTKLTMNAARYTIEINATAEGSPGAVHLALSKDTRRMVGAAYGAGAIDIFDTSDDGIKFLKSVNTSSPHSAVSANQTLSHPHQAVLDPTGQYFVVNDLGRDKMYVLDSTNDSFAIINYVPVEPSGCGPRHGAFFPAGAAKATHYMVVCEKANLVKTYALKYGGAKGIEFYKAQSLSTFTTDEPPAGASASELIIAQDNKNMYVSNRVSSNNGTDTIAHFRIEGGSNDTTNGTEFNPWANPVTLELVGLTSTGGKSPRMMSLTDDGETLLVGNMNGAMAVVALKRNKNGTLDETPVASMAMSTFTGNKGPQFTNDKGPQFVQQIG